MKNWIKYTIIGIICIASVLVLLNQVNKTFTAEKTELANRILSLLGKNNTLLEKVEILKAKVSNVDSTIVTYYDTLLFNTTDTIIQNDTIRDTLIELRPTWGNISFSDSSNKFVNILVNAEFPCGKTSVTYYNKYREKVFRKYFGLGIEKTGLMFSANIYYKKIGLGIYLRQEGKDVTKGTIISIAF